MKSLFFKTLFWFLGTAVITMAAIVLAAAMNFNSPDHRQPPFGILMSLQLETARRAYETGGREALGESLAMFQRVSDAEGILTDSTGRDLLTGEDRSDLVEAARARSRIPYIRRNRAAVARRSADGQYYFFLLVNRGNWIHWFLQPSQHLMILGVLLLLCYAFARHLTNPVRELQLAVDRFGRGDLKARVRSKRSDELGQLARAYDRMADRIESLLASERRLLLDISHELRSPLARLSVAVELARSSPDPEQQLDRIEREAKRLNGLVGELLQVTRAESDPASRRMEEVRLEELVRSVVEDSQIECSARRCTIRFEAEPLTLEGDPELLRRAVENVVRNAIRYTPEGGQVEVRICGSRITVRDYGSGVPESALNRIFDPFYRVEEDRSRVTGGVGLGLAIAKRAVELHKGTISARNVEPGLKVTLDFSATRTRT